MVEPWGYHLMLNCSGANHESICNPINIMSFSRELVKRIDMVAYGEPQVVRFGEGNKAGYTLVQLISTSSVTCHFCEETDEFYLDVFSCKPFKKEEIYNCVDKYFTPKLINENYLERKACIFKIL